MAPRIAIVRAVGSDKQGGLQSYKTFYFRQTIHYTRGLSTCPIANIRRWRALMWQLYIHRTSTCVRYAVNCLPVFFQMQDL
jgi:hypothetical protein